MHHLSRAPCGLAHVARRLSWLFGNPCRDRSVVSTTGEGTFPPHSPLEAADSPPFRNGGSHMSPTIARALSPTLFLAAFLIACASDGPGGLDLDSQARLAGQVSPGPSMASGFGGTTVKLFDASGRSVFATATGAGGSFSGQVPAGTHTVVLDLPGSTNFAFNLAIPAGEALFVNAVVDGGGAGGSVLSAQIFRDQNADGQADDGFLITLDDVAETEDDDLDEELEELDDELDDEDSEDLDDLDDLDDELDDEDSEDDLDEGDILDE